MPVPQSQQPSDNNAIDLNSKDALDILSRVADSVVDEAAAEGGAQPPAQPEDTAAASAAQGTVPSDQVAQLTGMVSALQQQIVQMQQQMQAMSSQKPTQAPGASAAPSLSPEEWQELFAEKPEEAIKVLTSPLNGELQQLKNTVYSMAELNQFIMTHPDANTPEMQTKMQEAMNRIPDAQYMRPGQLLKVAYELAKAATPAAPTQPTVADILNNPDLMTGLVQDKKARAQLAKLIIETAEKAPPVIDSAPGAQAPAAYVPDQPKNLRDASKLLKTRGLLDKLFGGEKE